MRNEWWYKGKRKRKKPGSRWMPSQAFWRDYNLYLQSQEWRYIRALVLQRAGGVCELCRQRRAAHVHHLTYDHVFHERLYELQAVCLPCHDAIHHGRLTDTALF